jgi:hypothetical protein
MVCIGSDDELQVIGHWFRLTWGVLSVSAHAFPTRQTLRGGQAKIDGTCGRRTCMWYQGVSKSTAGPNGDVNEIISELPKVRSWFSSLRRLADPFPMHSIYIGNTTSWGQCKPCPSVTKVGSSLSFLYVAHQPTRQLEPSNRYPSFPVKPNDSSLPLLCGRLCIQIGWMLFPIISRRAVW